MPGLNNKCSTPEPDGFGGGAVVIDLGSVTVISRTSTDKALKAALCG